MILRKPEYLSPSALFTYENNNEEYFMRYLAPIKLPPSPQTQPMASGSAFDAYVKSHLHNAIYGKNHKDAAKYELRALFDAQVSQEWRAWGWEHGAYIFKSYIDSGALNDLMTDLAKAADDPRFEFDLRGEVNGSREGVTKDLGPVILMGKPDLRFITGEGVHAIHDWKVNGYCGNGNTSPRPGYLELREYNGHWMKKGCHKDTYPQLYKGLMINAGSFLEAYNEDWALQEATYCWLLGDPVGSDMLASVDQIVANCNKFIPNKPFPFLRIASHRARISDSFQFSAFNRFQYLWNILKDINTDQFYFFRNLSFEESKAKVDLLCKQAAQIMDNETPSDVRWALNLTRN